MWFLEWLRKLARRLRIGWPRQYRALLAQGTHTLTGQDVALTYTPASDTTPNAFTFVDQTGVAVSTVITSAAVTISGLSTGTSITLNASGGTIDKNGNANFLGSQLVQNGDTVRARVTSSASNSTATNCTVAASPSGVQDTFTATTTAAASSFVFASGWSGTVPDTDGQPFSISFAGGIDGAVRADERPLKWIPGTNISGTSGQQRDTTTLTLQNNASVGQSSILPYSGHAGTIDQAFPVVPTDACNWQTTPITSIGSAGQMYASYYVRYGYSHTSDGSNNKMFRIWNTAMTSSMYAPNHFVQTISEDGSNAAGGGFYSVNDASNTWYVFEYMFRENSATNVHDGYWNFALNGGLAMNDTDLWTTRESGVASDSIHHRVFGPQMSNQPPPGVGSHLYMADVYVTDTLLRAFISPESTYTTTRYTGQAPFTTERQVQLLGSSGNSTGTLNGTLRLGAHSANKSGKSLWVVSSAMTRYRVGGWP